jgi:hypothetical protein
MKNHLFPALASSALIILLALASCASLPRHTLSAPTEWLEGKELEIAVTLRDPSSLGKGEALELSFRGPDGAEYRVDMPGTGQLRAASIPAAYLKPGTLDYEVIIKSEKEERTLAKGEVRVLSRSEGYAKRQAELAARVDYRGDLRVPSYRAPRVSFATRLDPGYRAWLIVPGPDGKGEDARPLEPGLGAIEAKISREELDAGLVRFALEISAPDRDFSEVLARLPGPGSYFSLEAASRDETLSTLRSQFAQALSANLPSEASRLWPETLKASFSLEAGSWLAEQLEGAPRVFFGSGGRHVEAGASGGTYEAALPLEWLSGSAVEIAVSAEARLEDFGEIGARIAARELRVIAPDQARAKIERELAGAFVHLPPARALDTRDLDLSAKISLPPGALALRGPGMASVTLDLLYAPGKALPRSARMAASGGSFSAVIPAQSLRAGTDRYWFKAGIDTGSALGRIEVELPGGAPYSILVAPRDELALEEAQRVSRASSARAEALKAGGARIEARPPSLPSGAKAFAYLKRPGFGGWEARSMGATTSAFALELDARDLASGYAAYWVAFSWDDPALGRIEARYPALGPEAPLPLPAYDPDSARNELERGLARRLSHEPPKRLAEKGATRIEARVAGAEPSTRLRLRYRLDGGPFALAEMARSGDSFAALIDAGGSSLLEYYLDAVKESGFAGLIAARLPAKGLYELAAPHKEKE